MPSNKILEEKKQVVESLAAKIQSAQAGVLVKYEGIKVSEDTELRAALRKAGVEYTVMKNTLTGRACDIAGYGDMKQYLSDFDHRHRGLYRRILGALERGGIDGWHE